MSVSVVDLFCGVGGMTHGFILEGFNVVAGIDIDESCEYPYQANNDNSKFYKEDILTIPTSYIEDLYPTGDLKILIGCAPCQPYSSNARAKRRNDDKWKLVPRFAEIIQETQPEIVSMENVPDLVNFQKKAVFNNFVDNLRKSGYSVYSSIIYCPDYGVPQTRKRLVLLASKLGDIKLIEKTHHSDAYPTVKSTIFDLPPLNSGETHIDDPLHFTRKLSDLNLKRIRQSRPGGTWKDWDEELVAACHRKASGASYRSVYGRMVWNEPAPTITTQAYAFGSGRFGHPEQDRALSLREMALLQTFPEDYEFVKPNEHVYLKRVGTLIGNAVPVTLGRVVARSIERHLTTYGYTIGKE